KFTIRRRFRQSGNSDRSRAAAFSGLMGARTNEEHGMRILVWFTVMAFIGLQGLPVRAQSLEPLPAVQFRLHCFDNSAERTAAEIEAMLALHEFAREHDAEAVWLDAVITADAGAGACSRDVSEFPDQPFPTGERARIIIQP